VHRLGAKRWSEIAAEIPGRRGKQCRERFLNHLDPHLNKQPWTTREDEMLAHMHGKVGNRWSSIAKCLPGRAENAVKNRFHLTHKRRLGGFSGGKFHAGGGMDAKKRPRLAVAAFDDGEEEDEDAGDDEATDGSHSMHHETSASAASAASSEEHLPKRSPVLTPQVSVSARSVLTPLSDVATSLQLRSFAEQNRQWLREENLVASALDVQLAFDPSGRARLVHLAEPVIVVTARTSGTCHPCF
jgi:hypothetical protein